MENSVKFPQKHNNRTTMQSNSSLFGVPHQSEKKTLIWKDACTQCLLLHNTQSRYGELSINRWVDKKKLWYTHNKIQLSHTKEWNLAITNRVNEPRGYYAKWNKSDRKIIYCMFSFIYRIYEKKNTGKKYNKIDRKN